MRQIVRHGLKGYTLALAPINHGSKLADVWGSERIICFRDHGEEFRFLHHLAADLLPPLVLEWINRRTDPPLGTTVAVLLRTLPGATLPKGLPLQPRECANYFISCGYEPD